MWSLSAPLGRLISHFGRGIRSNWNLSLFNIARAYFKSEWILDWLLVFLGELFLSQSSVDPLKHTFLGDHTLWTFLYLDLSCQLSFSSSLLQGNPRFLRCSWRGRRQLLCVRIVAAGRIIWILDVFDFELLDARIWCEKSWIWESVRVIELGVIKHGVVCSWIFVVAPRFLKCKTLLFWLTLRIDFTRAVRSKQCLSQQALLLGIQIIQILIERLLFDHSTFWVNLGLQSLALLVCEGVSRHHIWAVRF